MRKEFCHLPNKESKSRKKGGGGERTENREICPAEICPQEEVCRARFVSHRPMLRPCEAIPSAVKLRVHFRA